MQGSEKFHRQAAAGETINHTANFQVSVLEDFCNGQGCFNILVQLCFILKFFLSDKNLLFGFRIPSVYLFLTDINKCGLLLNVPLELLHKFK